MFLELAKNALANILEMVGLRDEPSASEISRDPDAASRSGSNFAAPEEGVAGSEDLAETQAQFALGYSGVLTGDPDNAASYGCSHAGFDD